MKLTNMIMIMTGIMIFLALAGINVGVGFVLNEFNITTNQTGDVTSSVGNNPGSNIGNSWLFQNLTIILGAAAVAGVTISFFTKVPAENILIIPIVLFFAKFIADWVGLILLTNSYCEAFTQPLASCAWVTWMVVVLVIPIAVGFAMATIDWWRGRD